MGLFSSITRHVCRVHHISGTFQAGRPSRVGPYAGPGRGVFYELRVARSDVVSLSRSRRYAASESAKKAVARSSWFVARKSSPSFRMGCGQISQRAALWDGPYEPQTHSPRATSHELRTTKKALENSSAFFTRISGFLSSQGASPQVLSAFAGLTAVFGMGTGGSPQLSPLN